MALFSPIPSIDQNKNPFNDVFDYLEKIKERKQKGEQFNLQEQRLGDQFKMEQALARDKLGQEMALERAKLAQQGKLDPLRMELLKAKIAAEKNPKLGAGEKTKLLSLVEAGRNLKSMHERANKVKGIIEKNPNLTGWIPGTLAQVNLATNQNLADFEQTTKKLQADMARYGSTRGGAQALKWAERAKPSMFRQTGYNEGMINSIMEDVKPDYEELKKEYETLSGQPYPVEMTFEKTTEPPTGNNANNNNQKATKWVIKNGKAVKA